MALSPERLQQLRQKYGIPEGGYSVDSSTGTPKVASPKMSAQERISNLWGEPVKPKMSLSQGLKHAAVDIPQSAAKGAIKGILGAGEDTLALGGAIESGLDQTLGRGINMALGKGNIPTDTAKGTQENVDLIRSAREAPELATPGVTGAIGNAIGYGADLAASAPADVGVLAEKGIAALGKKATEAGAKLAAKSTEKSIEKIADIVSPKLTTVRGSKALKTGKAEAEAPGIFTPGKISYANDSRTRKIVDAVKDVVNPAARTVTESFNNIRNGIEGVAETVVKPFLTENKVPFNFEDLRTRLTQVQPSSGLKADSGAFKTYSRVRDELLDDVASFLRKNSDSENITDTNELWNARKVVDAKIERELGQATFGSPQYTGVKAAARDMRTAFNKFITDSLENPGQAETLNKMYDFLQTARSKGISLQNEGEAIEALRKQFGINDFEEDVARAAFFKDNLERMNLMFEALDNMAPKVLGEAGKTGIQIWVKQHPLAAKALGLLGGGALAGLGFGGIQAGFQGGGAN